jgi:hypothetical protein
VEIPKFRRLIFTVVCSIILTLALGLVENSPSASIVGARSYGYPLAWRTVITSLTDIVNYSYVNFVVDLIFWFFALFLLLELVDRAKTGRWKEIKLTRLATLVGMFLLSALMMDFLHELGHALWGTVAGGNLTYMQVTFFVLYPKLELASHFRLGYVNITGLSSFGHGLFLLGGSLTTNIVAWLIAIILLKKEFSYNKRNFLKMSGIIGLLDLPLYVFLPQIGLSHWIFIGGNTPEPLIGASEMGIPDPVFYLIVLLVIFGLTFLYFKSSIKAILGKLKNYLMPAIVSVVDLTIMLLKRKNQLSTCC